MSARKLTKTAVKTLPPRERVYIVYDEQLPGFGCRVTPGGAKSLEFAQSALEALKCIDNAGSASLILILSDINMPGMSGFELLPKAKAARPDVPVIMITAYGDAETKRKVQEYGADALFTKPIDFVSLRGEIDTRIEQAA